MPSATCQTGRVTLRLLPCIEACNSAMMTKAPSSSSGCADCTHTAEAQLPHLASGHAEEDGPPPAVAGPPEVVQGHRCLHHICGLDEDQLVRHELLPSPAC